MRNYNAVYYLLFVLIVFGAFASMAQNDYGIKILGFTALAFALLFLVQLIWLAARRGTSRLLSIIELFSLVLLSLILSMRVFYIRFPFVEIVFGAAGLGLILVYLVKTIKAFSQLKTTNSFMAWIVLIFYGSVILYAISMTIVPFLPALAEPAGGAGFALLIIFLLAGLLNRGVQIDGEKISTFRYVLRFKDRSVVLLTLFLLFTAYMGFTKIGVLPRMYSDEYPRAYFELVNAAESGREKPVDGKYKHEEFKEQYDRFVARNAKTD